MCKTLKVSKSGYYDWVNRSESSTTARTKEHTKMILSIYKKSKQRYGSYKITKALKKRGVITSRNRVARIMKREEIRSIINRKYRVQTTDSEHDHKIADNILNRDFKAAVPAQKWVSDITYIRTDQGWLYLTMIMDLFDRKIIGWSLSDNMSCADTVLKAWKMANKNRPATPNMIFHSDRGVQYAADDFRKELESCNVIQSMSRKGNCWDNAVAENFFKILKSELIYHRHYYSHFQAKVDVFDFIEIWYNKQRTHSALGYLTPDEFGKFLLNNAA